HRALQKEQALELIAAACVTIPPARYGFCEIQNFQYYYARKNIAIVVYDSQTFGSGRVMLYNLLSLKVVNICHDAAAYHCDTFLNLTGAAKSKFICDRCNKKYQYVDRHVCNSICPRCFVTPSCIKDDIETLVFRIIKRWGRKKNLRFVENMSKMRTRTSWKA
ncbi:hypothetical protein TSAR_013323, partial [Trichomalopsis sarcophagae]